ncbi:MAG: sodium:solute symporter family protein [Eubacterium sp.]|nr:sodium:solute symporter family protein [Eubacterium sp.]
MNYVFLIALGIYLLIFLIISLLDMKGIKTFTDYAVAGRVQGSFAVTMTLLATVVGASTTIGICDTVYSIGFPGIWWLAFGAIGLILQSVFISGKVRATEADTLPDLAKITVGRGAELIIALIIVISWIGVIAGQLVAMNSLISFATGRSDTWLFVIVSAVVIIYTLIGGQSSVVKTDKLQFIIIIVSSVLCCAYLYLVKGDATGNVATNIELLNDNYTTRNLLTQFFVIGGVYFLGPDIISRNFISRDENTAKKSALIAGIGLFGFSLVITLIGMWIRYNVTPDQLADSKALMYIAGVLPKYISIPLIFGLLSAILSSTDTCIINASSIFVKDIMKRESVRDIRITVGVIGAIAIVLAVSGRGDIMSLLTGAYSVYTPGVIFPLLVAILSYRKNGVRPALWISAVIVGGLFGIAGTYFGNLLAKLALPQMIIDNLTLIGMLLSLLLSLISVKWSSQNKMSSEEEQ